MERREERSLWLEELSLRRKGAFGWVAGLCRGAEARPEVLNGACARPTQSGPSTITTINKQINKTPPRSHSHHLCFALARTRSIQDPRKTLSATSGLTIL